MSYRESLQSSRSIAVGETYSFDIEKPLAYGTALKLTIGAGSDESIYSFKAGKPATQQTLIGVVVTYDPMYNNGRLTVVNMSDFGYPLAVTFKQVVFTVDNDAYMFGPYKRRVNVKQIDLKLGATTESGGVYSTDNSILYLSTLKELGITEDYSMLAVLVAFGTGDAMPDARKYHPPWDVYNNRLYPWVEITDTKTWLTIRYSTTDNAVVNKNVWVKLLFDKMPEGVSI